MTVGICCHFYGAKPANVGQVVPVMVKVMYPIERCVDIGLESQHWHDDLAHDPCYAQSVSEIAGVYFDITRSPNSYLQMLLHLDSALGPLRNSLADTDVVVTDSMIFLVVSLALVSQSFDELDGALTHLRGLHQLIKLRGGVTALAHKRSLQIKCCRVDLALAMRTGDRPLFFTRDNISWKPYLANVSKSLPPPWQSLVSAPDIRLVNVFLDLREFTTSINLAHQTQRKIPPSLFQEVLISVQYRLQHLSYAINDKQETLRLAMLAFSTTLFLEAHSAPLYCKSLSCLLREALRVLGQGNDCTELELKLWLFFVGRISILNLPEDQSWLEARVLKINEALGLTTWAEVRSVLKGFLWVDIVHGKAGEMIFKRLDTATPG